MRSLPLIGIALIGAMTQSVNGPQNPPPAEPQEFKITSNSDLVLLDVSVKDRPSSLTIVSDRSGNRSGSALRRRARKAPSSLELGSAGRFSENPLATSRIRSQRSGERTTR